MGEISGVCVCVFKGESQRDSECVTKEGWVHECGTGIRIY